MALKSRLEVEIDGRSAEQQALAVRKALEALTEAGLRVGPILSAAFNGLSGAAQGAKEAANNLNAARRALDGVNEAGKKTGGIIGGAAGSVSTMGANAAAAEAKLAAARKALEELNRAGGKSAGALNGAGGAMAGASQNARAATTQVQSLERQVKSLASQAAGLAGPLAAAFSLKAFYDAAEAYSTLTNRMKLVTSSAQELATAQNAVFSIAQSSYQPLTATAELYQRIATNQKELGLTGKQVAGVVGTISKTLAISGASAASANAALIQLGQAFASGVLRGEELNSVMEQAPALAQAIAQGMGKTVGELRSLGAEGKLTADTVVKALQAQQGAVDALFAKMSSTIGQSFTAVGNSFQQFVGRMDQASGASAAISARIIAVSQAIDSLTADSDSLNTTINAVGAAMTGVAAGGAVLLANKLGTLAYAWSAGRAAAIAQAEATLNAANADAIKARSAAIAAQADMALYRGTILQTVAAGKYAEARLKQAAADAAARDAAVALSAAQRGLLAFLTGPAGIALAVGSVAASMFLMRDNTDQATAALDQHGLSVKQVAEKYAELSGAQQRVKRLEWVDQQKEAIDAASSALDRYIQMVQGGVLSGNQAGIGSLAPEFKKMIEEVRAGQRDLDSVTKWLESSISLYPQAEKALANLTSQYDQNAKRSQDLGVVLGLVDKGQKDVAASAAAMATAQGQSGTQTKAQTAEIEKYLAKLREQRDLYGASKQAQAEYEASKMGMNAQQREEARIIGSQIDILEQYKEAIKKGDKARQESLKNELVALYTQQQATEDAATAAANASKRVHNEAAQAAKESADRQIAEMNRVINKAVNLAKGRNLLLAPEAEQQSITGRSMVLPGAPTPQNGTVPRVSPLEQANKAIAQLNETVDETTKKVKAYTESAGQKMLNQASEQAAVLREQNLLYDLQKGQVEKIGPEQQKLIRWEQELADIKSKKTLTADQKSLLADEAAITAKLKANVALEKQLQIKQRLEEQNKKLLEFEKNIRNELELSAQELSNQLAGVGMGAEGRRRLQEDLKIRQDYQKKMNDLQEQLNKGELDRDVYDKETRLLEDALDKRLAMQQDYYRQLEIQQGNWANGANAAYQDYIDSASDIAGQTYDAFSNAFQGMEDALVDFVMTGKLSFKDLANSIIADIARILIRTKVVTPILNSLFGGSGGGGGLASAVTGGGSGGGFNLESAWNTASSAYSVATSGFGSAVSAGWQAGEGFLGGVQGALKAGAGYIGSGISGLFASSGGTMVNGVYQLGASAAPATVDLISNTVTNSATGAVTGTASGATSAAATGLSASSAVMYGIGGAIQGYLKAGVKGAVAGAGGAVAGAYAGAAIGSVVPIIGNVIGGAIGAVVGGMFGASLFGGDWITKDQGFQLGVENGDLQSYSFEYQKKKGGLFSSNKKRTRLTAMDPEMQAALDATYASTLGTVIGLFDSLSVELNDGVLDGLNVAATQISTKDKTAEEIQAELAKWFNNLGTAASQEINKVMDVGFGQDLTIDYLTTFVGNLYSVNDSLKMLGVAMVDLNVAGGRTVESLVNMSGGIESLNENMTKFYDGFTTDTQKASDTLAGVRAQFASMGLTLPETREAFAEAVRGLDITSEAERQIFASMTANAEQAAAAYTILENRQQTFYSAFYSDAENTARSMEAVRAEFKKAGVDLPATRDAFRSVVEGIDRSTEAGKKLYDSMMALAGSANTLYTAQEEILNNAVTASFSAVQRAVNAEKNSITQAYNARVSSLNDMLSTAQQGANDLRGVSTALSNALKALRGEGDDAVRMMRDQAKATVQAALATARSGGSLAGFSGLEDALGVISENDSSLYGSLEEFNREQGRNANLVAELNAINGKQLTADEELLRTLRDQISAEKDQYDQAMERLDNELLFAQKQIDALNGVDNSVISVRDAMNSLAASITAALAARPTGSAAANTSQNNSTLLDTVYQQVLGRDVDTAGAAYWGGLLQSGGIDYAGLVAAITNDAKLNGEIPAFATGGMHTGGIRLVGERGPELEVTGPSRIYNASQTAAMLKGGDGWKEVVAAIQVLQQYAYQTTKNTGATAIELRQQNESGVVIQGATA